MCQPKWPLTPASCSALLDSALQSTELHSTPLRSTTLLPPACPALTMMQNAVWPGVASDIMILYNLHTSICLCFLSFAIFTESAHWANSVYKSRCLSVCMSKITQLFLLPCWRGPETCSFYLIFSYIFFSSGATSKDSVSPGCRIFLLLLSSEFWSNLGVEWLADRSGSVFSIVWVIIPKSKRF